MSVESKTFNWGRNCHRVKDALANGLHSYITFYEKLKMAVVCKSWNNLAHDKNLWKGRFIIDNKMIKQLTVDYYNRQESSIIEYLNSFNNWIVKMNKSLSNVTELTMDIVHDQQQYTNILQTICSQLISVANITILEIVAQHENIQLIKLFSDKIEKLVLNVRDEHYLYDNLKDNYHNNRPIMMHNSLLLFFSTYRTIIFPKVTNYNVYIHGIKTMSTLNTWFNLQYLDTVYSNKNQHMEKTFYHQYLNMMNDLYLWINADKIFYPNLRNFELKSDDRNIFQATKANNKYTNVYKKYNHIGTSTIQYGGLSLHSNKENLKEVTLTQKSEFGTDSNYDYLISDAIQDELKTIENFNIDCCLLEYTDFFNTCDKIFHNVKKITVKCNCKRYLVKHKFAVEKLKQYKEEGKQIVIDNHIEKLDSVDINCDMLNRYVSVNDLNDLNQIENISKKTHVNYQCFCEHIDTCIGKWITFLETHSNIIQSCNISFDHNHDIYSHKHNFQMKNIIEQLKSIDVLTQFTYVDRNNEKNNLIVKFNNKTNLTECMVNYQNKNFLNLKLNQLYFTYFLKTGKVFIICNETGYKFRHYCCQLTAHIEKLDLLNIYILTDELKIKCTDLKFYKKHIKYYKMSDYDQQLKVRIRCECIDNMCNTNVLIFIQEHMAYDVQFVK